MRKILAAISTALFLSGCATLGDLRDVREESNKKSYDTLDLLQRNLEAQQKYAKETGKLTQDVLDYMKGLEQRIADLEKQKKKTHKKK